jgi:fatty-acyl-CoA synthase
MVAGGIMTFSTSHWPVDFSQPVVDVTVGDALRGAAAEAPHATALVEGAVDPAARRRWSYAELLEASERAARALLGRFAVGDRVAVWANNIPEWVILELAAGLAGMTIVTVNPALRQQELAYVLGQSQANGIFLVPAYRASPMAELVQQVRGDLPALREVVSFAGWEEFCAEGAPDQVLPEVTPDAPAQIQYTSGTTGFPKGAVLHHRGIVNNARLYTARLGVGPGSVQLSAMPLFHTAGCVMSVLGAVVTRGTLILPPYFDPGLMLDLIAAERPDGLLGVPTMLISMLDHPGFHPGRHGIGTAVVTGGAVVPPALVGRVEAAFGAPVSIVFAQTEASPVITQTSPHDTPQDRAHTLGRPLPQARRPTPTNCSRTAASTSRRTRHRATGPCCRSSRKRRRARSRNSCCASASSPRGLMSRFWPRAPTEPPLPALRSGRRDLVKPRIVSYLDLLQLPAERSRLVGGGC